MWAVSKLGWGGGAFFTFEIPNVSGTGVNILLFKALDNVDINTVHLTPNSAPYTHSVHHTHTQCTTHTLRAP